jgi:hypothetical protein
MWIIDRAIPAAWWIIDRAIPAAWWIIHRHTVTGLTRATDASNVWRHHTSCRREPCGVAMTWALKDKATR